MIAAAILSNLALGAWMHRAIESPQSQSLAIAAFQLHKSIGLTVLVLSLFRLAWRFLYPPPPLPGHMSGLTRLASRFAHWTFYGLMIGIPLSGWLYVSAQWRGDAPFNVPTLWFGLFEVPHLFGLNALPPEQRSRLAGMAVEAHELLALGMALLLGLHIAAALKHHYVDRDGVLARMLPWLESPESGQPTPQPRARSGVMFECAAALATITIAVVFTFYATTTTLGPQTIARQAPAAAEALQQIVSASGTQAPAWQINAAESEIGFSGAHVRRPFKGRFEDWQAAIHFDPDDPGQSQIAAIVETGSATDGVTLHDRTLPEREWFDVANNPHASYRSTQIRHLGGNRYAVEGTLTIKSHAVELPPLTLVVDSGGMHISGKVQIDRADVDMGMESDPRGQYVSRKIGITVDVTASRKP